MDRLKPVYHVFIRRNSLPLIVSGLILFCLGPIYSGEPVPSTVKLHFSCFMEFTCLETPRWEKCVETCDSAACRIAGEQMLKKIKQTLHTEISSKINPEDVMILPMFCKGDDAIAVTLEMETFTVHIIDSRKFTVIVEDYLIENEQLININQSVTEIFNAVARREMGPREPWSIMIQPFLNYPYSASGYFSDETLDIALAEFWYTPELTVFSWFHHDFDTSVDERAAAENTRMKPGPYILFPELRQTLLQIDKAGEITAEKVMGPTFE